MKLEFSEIKKSDTEAFAEWLSSDRCFFVREAYYRNAWPLEDGSRLAISLEY